MSRLFLGNIPHAASEYDISEWMQSFGFVVDEIEIIKDRVSGMRRGFCFVSLVDGAQVDSAIGALHRKPMMGRPITVNYAAPREVRPDDRERRHVA
jgi:RNA recognition motif-containing protein